MDGYQINDKIMCHKKGDVEGSYRKGTIVDMRIVNGVTEYYIRYVDFNNRLDEWTTVDNIRKFDSHANIIKPIAKTDEANKKTRSSLKSNMNALAKSTEPVGAISMNPESEAVTRTKNIEKITFGKFDLNCWYYSPYPGKYGICDHLYICDHCLKYMEKVSTYVKHCEKCPYRFPPGLLIYKDPEEKIAFFEVDGAVAKLFCQSLCLLSKLFLDHKTLYYDVEPFYFYVICQYEVNEQGEEDYHIVGYFSKEKASPDGYNLSCVMVLPCYQKKGYGKMLISMSYELSKIEGIPGSPEKPLSDLGLLSFRSYWTYTILHELSNSKVQLSISDLTLRTGITKEDCVSTLDVCKLIKGRKGSQTLEYNKKQIDTLLAEIKGCRCVKKQYLKWKPHTVLVKKSEIMDELKSYC